MPDETLRVQLAFEGGDLVKGGLEEIASATEASTARMKAGFRTASDESKSGSEKMQYSMMEARHAIMGAGEEIGLHMPRFVSSFLASIGPVGSIMSVAFAPVAVIGLLSFLKEVPEAVSKLSDAMMGFGAAQKKAFEETIKDSEAAFTHTKNLTEAQANLRQTVKVVGDMAQSTFSDRWKVATEDASRSTSFWMSALGLGAFTPVVAGIMGVKEATSGAADAAAMWQKRMNELLSTVAEDTESTQERLAQNETEYLKLGEIGAGAYGKMGSELAILNLEEAEQLAKLSKQQGDQTENIRLTRELYAIKREAAEKTAALEGGGEASAAAKARVEADKSVNLALVEAKLKSAKDLVAIDKSRWPEEIAAERFAEDEKYAIEFGALEKEKALAIQRQGITGKSEAPEIAALNAKIQEAEIARYTAKQHLDTETTEHIIADAAKVEAAFRAQFEHQMKEAAESAEEQKRGIEAVRAEDEQAVSIAELDANRILRTQTTTLDERLKTHQITMRAYVADEKAANDEWYSSQKASLAQEGADLATFYGTQRIEYKRFIEKKEALDAEYDRKNKALQTQEETSFQRTMNSMTSSFNSSLEKWISGQERWRYAWVGMWSGALNAMTMSIVKMGEQELVGLMMHKAAAKQGVFVDAKKAATDAYSATTDIPIVGPFLAPAAAAAAFAAVLALGSFDVGGQSTASGIAMIHENEIVMPPDVSSAFRSMAKGGGVGGGISVPVTMGNVSAIDAQGVDKVLDRQARSVQRQVLKAVRNMGALSRGGVRR